MAIKKAHLCEHHEALYVSTIGLVANVNQVSVNRCEQCQPLALIGVLAQSRLVTIASGAKKISELLASTPSSEFPQSLQWDIDFIENYIWSVVKHVDEMVASHKSKQEGG